MLTAIPDEPELVTVVQLPRNTSWTRPIVQVWNDGYLGTRLKFQHGVAGLFDCSTEFMPQSGR